MILILKNMLYRVKLELKLNQVLKSLCIYI
jgi:hypothetical protein